MKRAVLILSMTFATVVDAMTQSRVFVSDNNLNTVAYFQDDKVLIFSDWVFSCEENSKVETNTRRYYRKCLAHIKRETKIFAKAEVTPNRIYALSKRKDSPARICYSDLDKKILSRIDLPKHLESMGFVVLYVTHFKNDNGIISVQYHFGEQLLSDFQEFQIDATVKPLTVKTK